MPGHGLRQTSSPTSPRTGAPLWSTTSMSWPSAGKPTATGLIGSVITVVRKHAPTSVPPLMFTIGARDPDEEAALHEERALRPARRAGGVREQVRRFGVDLDRWQRAGLSRHELGPLARLTVPFDHVLDGVRPRFVERRTHLDPLAAP